MATKIPMNARDQLQAARDLGHELQVITRGPWPELGDPHPKYYVACSCGWKAKNATRSRKGANWFMVRHLGQVIADGIESA